MAIQKTETSVTLRINQLDKKMYDDALAAGEIVETELYSVDEADDPGTTALLNDAAYVDDVPSEIGEIDTSGLDIILRQDFILPNLYNPNLLDNSYFYKPVNQRGQTTYSTAGYTIDRWAIAYNQLTVTAKGIMLTKNADLVSHIFQILPTNSNGKMRTLTVATADGTFTVSGAIGTQPVRKETPFGYIQFYIPSGLDAVLIDFGKKGSTLYWAKLEEGSVSTPYVPKGYGLELLECQRYFIARVGIKAAGIVTGSTFSTFIYTPIEMRVIPTVTIVTADNVVFNGTYKGITGTVSSIGTKYNGIYMTLAIDASGVVNQPGIAFALAMNLSADL